MPVPDLTMKTKSDKTIVLTGDPAIEGGSIRYTLDGSIPSADSKVWQGSINFSDKAQLKGFRAATFTRSSGRHSLLF